MRVVQLGVISVFDLVCCVLIAIIAHKQRSRALVFVLIAFFVAALSNAFRIYSFLVFAEPPNLLNYSKASNIGFIVNYLSVVLYSFGYWGFVIEKQRSSLAQEMAKRRNAELGELEAKDREVITLKYLKHSDELVEMASRLHKAVQSGALSASIAHEISQPLTTIRLAAEEACDALQKGVNRGRVEELLEVIVLEGRRAGNIIRTLRNLFAGSRASQEQRTLDEVLLAVCRIIERQLKRISATLKIELRAPVQLRLGVGEIEQVILNLLTNAIDAVSRSGESPREIALFSWIEGEYAYVRVVDTGPGVPVDLSEKIFEIFSSDRPDGLGLGLWLSRFIVERYDGEVLLERQEGKPETSFLVKLPVSRNPSS